MECRSIDTRVSRHVISLSRSGRVFSTLCHEARRMFSYSVGRKSSRDGTLCNLNWSDANSLSVSLSFYSFFQFAGLLRLFLTIWSTAVRCYTALLQLLLL